MAITKMGRNKWQCLTPGSSLKNKGTACHLNHALGLRVNLSQPGTVLSSSFMYADHINKVSVCRIRSITCCNRNHICHMYYLDVSLIKATRLQNKRDWHDSDICVGHFSLSTSMVSELFSIDSAARLAHPCSSGHGVSSLQWPEHKCDCQGQRLLHALIGWPTWPHPSLSWNTDFSDWMPKSVYRYDGCPGPHIRPLTARRMFSTIDVYF